ncbi:MAG: hypothetical protein COZ43_01235 [Sphingomonadales bacterium CG_4_10_14_3_um_filter_58_15]|nr:MAG: hypothetical protein COZ43_01235 [Sphingomonadales bacterium CG_4_10_14_3_um_filter_58_15]
MNDRNYRDSCNNPRITNSGDGAPSSKMWSNVMRTLSPQSLSPEPKKPGENNFARLLMALISGRFSCFAAG